MDRPWRARLGRIVQTVFGTWRRRVVTAVVVVLAVAGTWYGLTRGDDEPTATTVTAEVTASTVDDTVTGSGTLESARSSTLSFSSSGTVTNVFVEPGDRVKKGQKLATIDATALRASLASAEAQLDAAQTTAADDGSQSAAQRAANDAAVASAQADVADAEQTLKSATLRAPFAGMVATVDLQEGDRAGSGSSTGASSGAGGMASVASGSSSSITVISPRRFIVVASVGAVDVERITTGMQAQITPNGAAEAVFGTVAAVGRVAETGSDGTASFPVTVKLTGTYDNLYAGTSADVSIIVESREDVLTVPTAAIKTDGDQAYVTKVVSGGTEKVDVEIGDAFGMTTEITAGLEEGDKVEYTQVSRMPGGGGSGNGSGNGGSFPGGGNFPGGQMPNFPGGGGFPSGGGFPGGGTPGGGR